MKDIKIDKIKQYLPYLPIKIKQLLEMRFGLVDGVAHTLEEVGREFDVTRERVRQIEMKTLERIDSGYYDKK